MLSPVTRLVSGAFLVVCVPLFSAAPQGAVWSHYQALSAQALAEAQRAPQEIPPAPEGVVDLDFRDFFAPVVGDRGLEYTEKIQALAGQRVRILGYMVREPQRAPGVFMLTPWPTKVENDGYCVTEDLPPATLHVLLPAPQSALPSPYLPGRLLLTGVLEIGPTVTPDGRNATVRLRLDPPPAAKLSASLLPASTSLNP